MKGVRSRVGIGVAAALLLAALAIIAGASAKVGGKAAKNAIQPIPAFSTSQSTAVPTSDWISVHGSTMNQQYSGLNQINASTVKNLKVAWHTTVAVPTKGKPNFTGVLAEAEPVEYQGTMYMPDAKGNVFAFNATTGERLWYHKFVPPPHFTALLTTSRGVAIGGGNVYDAATDASITALDQSTGRENWKTYIGNWKTGATMTAAPTYVDGMVISGIAGGDAGARCQVVALDAKTGKVLWRFDVIPTGKEAGSETWPAKRVWTGGGAIWNTPAVDPGLGLVYVGVGNPVPYNGNVRGKGAELYTESMVALHIKTGKLAWAFQETHHDIWDYDVAANGVELFNLGSNKLIANAGKTGWVYILNRATGKPFLGIPEVPVPQSEYQNTFPTQPIPKGQPFAEQCAPKSWASWKSTDGNPVTVACLYYPYNDTNFTAFAPSALGGADWPPSSFSPATGNLYICSKDSSTAWKALPEQSAGKLKPLGNFFQVDGLYPQKGSPAQNPQGKIVAMNMHNNTRAWTVSFPVGDMCYSGVLSTAGNLVFVGRTDRTFQAYNAKTGKLLWTSPKLLASVGAAPISWSSNGKQYVAVYAGGNSLTAAFGTAKSTSGSELYAFALPS